MRKNQSHTASGFTLVEILIFVTIISMLFVVSLSLATTTLLTTKSNENRTFATYHTDALKEWLLSEREANWTNVLAHASSTGTTYCFNAPIDGATTWPAASTCAGYDLDAKYKREAVLVIQSVGSSSQVVATVQTSWRDGSNTSTTKLKTLLTP